MDADTAILIPARAGSTRMPEKLLRADTGRALVTYTQDAAERARVASAGRIGEVVVATDDARIEAAVREHAAREGYAARAVRTRADHACGTDRIAEAARALPESVRVMVNLQGDEPQVRAEDVLAVIRLLDAHPWAGMSTLVRPIVDEAEFHSPHAVKAVLGEQGRCLYFSRAPVPVDRDGLRKPGEPYGYLHLGVYGYRREVLLGYADLPRSEIEERERLEQLRALAAGIPIVARVTDYSGAGIDTEEDYRAFAARCGG